MGEVRRDDAERLGVVGDRPAASPTAATSSAGSRDVAGERRALAAAGAEAPALRRARTARPRAISGARDGERELARRGERARRRASAPLAHARARSPSRASGARRGLLGVAERLLEAAQRVAQLELAEDLAQPRAVGRARQPRRARSMSTGRSRWIVASTLGDARVLGVVDQVLLALGAGDLVDRARARPRGRRTAAAAATAVLSPMPGTPGMLSDVSPLRP